MANAQIRLTAAPDGVSTIGQARTRGLPAKVRCASTSPRQAFRKSSTTSAGQAMAAAAGTDRFGSDRTAALASPQVDVNRSRWPPALDLFTTPLFLPGPLHASISGNSVHKATLLAHTPLTWAPFSANARRAKAALASRPWAIAFGRLHRACRPGWNVPGRPRLAPVHRAWSSPRASGMRMPPDRGVGGVAGANEMRMAVWANGGTTTGGVGRLNVMRLRHKLSKMKR
jgi:hypothetical protein